MYKKGMKVEFTNKLSGSQYDGEITEVHHDMIVVLDDCDNIHKVPFKWWDITIL
jgi:hypothetical protein